METSRIQFNEIDREATYEGYLWLSDEQCPHILFDETIDEKFFSLTNPFIIEGQLYDRTNKKSYAIRYADGKTIVTLFELDDEDLRAKGKEYLPNHMKDIESLSFLDVWEEEKDPLCCKMEVLQPRALVFVGLNKKQENHAEK